MMEENMVFLKNMFYQCVFGNDDCSYHAFIFADTEEDLFDSIDEYGCPYSCKIYPISPKSLSFCVKATREIKGSDDTSLLLDELEISERLYNEIDTEHRDHLYFTEINSVRKLVKSKTS